MPITNRLKYLGPFVISACLLSQASWAQEEPTPFENRDEDVDHVIEPLAEIDREDAADAPALTGALEEVQDAAEVLQEMQNDSDLRKLLDRATGVFVIPDYAAAALIVGASGGEGVLFTRSEEGWAHPALYDVGGLSAGLQAGIAAGTIALVLLSQEAVDAFAAGQDFSFTANAGFVFGDWSARARGGLDEDADVVVWTDTEGLFMELAVGVSNVNYDEEANADYYGLPVEPAEILSGEVANPHRDILHQAVNQF